MRWKPLSGSTLALDGIPAQFPGLLFVLFVSFVVDGAEWEKPLNQFLVEE